MIKNLSKLIDLKSIITLILVVSLVFLVVCNVSISDDAIKTLFSSTVSSCFTYYFSRRKEAE